jgi:lipoprotein-releasing system permease protein
MTVMAGLVGQFKEKNHAFVGDCVVGTRSLVGFPYYEQFMAILEAADYVEAVSPVVKNYALLRSRTDDHDVGLEILGVDPVRHSRVTNFAETLYYRRNEPASAFQPASDPNAPGFVIGIDLALARDSQGEYTRGLRPVRSAVTLTCFPLNAKGAPGRAGSVPVASKQFYYSDLAHTGIARVDGRLVYIPLEEAQALCMAGARPRVTAIHVKLRPSMPPPEGRRRIAALWKAFRTDKEDAPDAQLLDTVRVETWKQYRRAAIAPMEKEEAMLGVMFGFVGITTVFIVFVVFYMIVSHKRKDIGILKSVGASGAGVMALFSGFALAVGLLGSALGVAGGWLFLARINQVEQWLFERFGWQLWDRTIYAIGDIPYRIEAPVVATIAACAVLACLIGVLVPGGSAARLHPVETLRVGPA